MMEFHRFPKIAMFLLSTLCLLPLVTSHGRLMHPASRASMWRLGFPGNRDYNDNQGFCGGVAVLHNRFHGKCGVCGDPWAPLPRPHERGGPYYNGQVTATYTAGSVITAEVEITANHKGYFEFRVCAYDRPEPGDIETSYDGSMVEVTQACLDKNLLQLESGAGTRFNVPYKNGFFKVGLRLPNHLSCNKCLFQWRYKTGNSWGKDENGISCVGCGNQEEFKACSDIIIKPSSGRETTWNSETQLDTTPRTDGTDIEDIYPTTTIINDNTRTTTEGQESTKEQIDVWTETGFKCQPSLFYARVPGMKDWCYVNCNRGFCPRTHCFCTTV